MTVNDNPETLRGASRANWPTIGTDGDWWVLPETDANRVVKRKNPPSEAVSESLSDVYPFQSELQDLKPVASVLKESPAAKKPK